MGLWEIVIPEAGTNLITNPSFETNTTGWSADGTNTIAQSTAQSRFGAYSALCTYQDDTDLARYDDIVLTAAAHTFSVYVYLGSTWDGGAIQLAFENFAGGSVTTATTTTTTLGSWVRLQATYTPVGGDLTGDLVVQAASAPTAGRFIYIDGAMCQALSYVTTYIDGDQDGCSWSGTAHGSTSTRSATSRAGGRVRDLKDDYGFKVTQMVDVGMSPLTQHLDEFATIRGGEVSGYKVHPREFVLVGTIHSLTSWSDLHDQIQGLENVLRPDAVPDNQPFILRYTGATVTKQISAYYLGGLSGLLEDRGGYRQDVRVQILAPDPTWYAGESSAAIDTSDDLTIYSVAGRSYEDGTWSNLGLSNDPDSGGSVRALLYASDGSLYIGGDFVDLDNTGTGIDRIAKYTPGTGTWSLVGAGSDIGNGVVRCLAEDSLGDIYVGGTFTAVAANGDMDYIAKWDVSGSTWVALGDPDSGGAAGWGGIYDLDFDTDGRLYAAGDYTTINGVADASYCAIWYGGSWIAAGDPAAGTVTDIRGVDTRSNVWAFAGGDFLNLEADADADYGAFYRLASDLWANVQGTGTGALFNAPVNTVLVAGGWCYMGGEFTNRGSANGDYIVRGPSNSDRIYEALGTGMNGIVWDLAEAPDGNIIMTGAFTDAGGTTVDRIAFWNGSNFTGADVSIGATVQVVTTGAVDPGDSSSYDWYIGLGAKAALSDKIAGTTTVTNNGNTEAFPQFVFKRSGGTSAVLRTITNETTNKALSFSYSLQDGETLTIDLHDKTIVSSASGNQISAVTAGSDFGSFSLLPGANTINCFVEIAGAPTVTAFAIWSDSYWSVS
jgi:hypothetical protein